MESKLTEIAEITSEKPKEQSPLFKELRRHEKKMEDSEAIELLKSGNHGVLSTVGSNGYPYGVPLDYVYVNGAIYFHGACEGYKLDNIQYNNRVSFCVLGHTEVVPEKFSTRYQSVIAFGRITEVDHHEKQDALIKFIQKYSKEYMENGLKLIDSIGHRTKVLKMSIEHISGKAAK